MLKVVGVFVRLCVARLGVASNVSLGITILLTVDVSLVLIKSMSVLAVRGLFVFWQSNVGRKDSKLVSFLQIKGKDGLGCNALDKVDDEGDGD